ncbi:protein phosphatase 2C domain-containing protein [Bradyrhizobium sp. HKCCYLS20291]|uniref:PP2C family protein-serine/threonine phosphatase n=1 Tax=Bradyrhizobium sp. HKCCYLS20291 TaxID=3420766 RepID=UPI003EC10BE1
MRLEISGRAIVGSGSKKPQQDSWRVFNTRGEDVSERAQSGSVATGDGTLVVVSDGIGGYEGGEIASRVACDAFAGAFFRHEGAVADRLTHALDVANMAIADEKRRNASLQDMGCTLIAAHFGQDRMTFVSVGDSLLLRSRDDEIHRVNLDHSYFDYLDRKVLGSNDPSRWSIAMADARQRGSLTLALTGGNLRNNEYGHTPQVATRPMLADDIIIVASDGIETLELVQLQNFVMQLRPSGIPGIAAGLIGAVDGIGQNRSYQDNTTIVVVGASSSAGLTRVAMTSRKEDTLASGAQQGRFAGLLSAWRHLRDTRILAGVAILAVVLLLAYLATGGGGSGDGARVQNPPPGRVPTTDTAPAKPMPEQRSDAGSPEIAGAGASAPQTLAVAPAPTPSAQAAARVPSSSLQQQQGAGPGQGQADQSTAEAPAAGSSDAQVQAAAQPTTLPRAGDLQGQGPKAELTPYQEFNGFAWKGQRLDATPGNGGCYAACVRDPRCVAFSSREPQDKQCHLFSEITGRDLSKDAQSSIREWVDRSWQGDRISAAPANPARSSGKCALECLKIRGCQGYTWNGAAGRCDLFSSINGTTPAPDVRSGSFFAK